MTYVMMGKVHDKMVVMMIRPHSGSEEATGAAVADGGRGPAWGRDGGVKGPAGGRDGGGALFAMMTS